MNGMMGFVLTVCNPGMKSISKLQRGQCHLCMCQAGKRKPTRKTQENKNVADR